MTQGGAGIASGNDGRGENPAAGGMPGSGPGPKGVATGQAALGRTAFLAGLLLALAIAAFGWTVWQDAKRDAAASGNAAIIAEAERFLSMMTSIETSTRGYVIAGTEDFLSPFRQNVADLPAQIARMESVWEEGGGDPQRLARLRELAEQEVALDTETARLRNEQGVEAASELVRSGAGKRVMDDIRIEVGMAQTNAQTRVDLADASAHRNDLIANVAFLAAILAAASLAFIAFRRHVESRRASGMLSAVLGNSPVAIGFIGRDGRLGRLNAAFAQVGASVGREVAVSDPLVDLFPHDRVMLERMLDETLRWGRVHNGVELHAGEGEGEQIYLASIYPLRTEGRIAQETVGAGVVLTNATKRLRAERRLAYSETRFRSLIEATSAIVWSVPSSGRFSGDQPGWSAFTGQTEEQYSGFGWTDAVHPDDRQRSSEAWKKAVAGEGTYKIEHRVRRADGEWRDMIGRAVPIRGPDGAVSEWVGTHTDITDQKRIAAELGHSSEQFRIIADNIPQFAWIASPSGDIDWYNQRWFDYTGTTMEEMRGHGWMKVHHPDHLDRVREQLTRSFAEGVKWEDAFPLRGADGTYRWFLSQAIPIRDETGAITRWFGTNTDITSQRAAEQELAAAKEAAENANRAKSQFIANMSHELRTPLSAVIGYAEMLEEEVEDLGQAHLLTDLKKIEQNARHLLSLINDVLDLSKIEAERMDVYAERFQLGDVMDEVASTVGSLIAKKNNRLEVRKDGDLGDIHTDQVKLRQCLINLLSNAAKFTEEGTITMSARREPQQGGDWIRLEVTDTGIGMTPEQLERLFQRFAQADESTTRKFGGTGLGLAITRAFCRLLGGDIGVTSEEGRGTTFTIRIPAEVEAPAEEATPEAAAAQTPVEGGAGLVLAIDDDPHARELVTRFLLREGFSVRTAADGLSGLEIARALKPDVILLDVTMPKMDGWAVLTELKGDPEVAGIPVVMITIIDEHSLGYALGAADYLLKPVEWNRLKAVLDRYRTADNGLILAVDDDEDGLHRTATMLEREGLKVITALNGREALARMEDERPGLILLDLVMPEMDGFAFLKTMRARSEWQGIPVVVLTSKDLTAEEKRFLQGQAEDIFTKGDVDLRELAAEIRVMVGQGAAFGRKELAQTGQSGSEQTT